LDIVPYIELLHTTISGLYANCGPKNESTMEALLVHPKPNFSTRKSHPRDPTTTKREKNERTS